MQGNGPEWERARYALSWPDAESYREMASQIEDVEKDKVRQIVGR